MCGPFVVVALSAAKDLHDAGNTTTLAHYLELLTGAGMLTGLPKYSGKVVRSRGSSPKLQVFNTALHTAREVDFVVRAGGRLVAIEVKSGRAPVAHSGLAAFTAAFKPTRTLLVGGDGVPVEEFLLRPGGEFDRAVESGHRA